MQVWGTAQTLDCIKDIAGTREDTTVSGVLQQFFKRYLERDTNEKSGERRSIGCRVDYVVWAKLQARATQKNMPLSPLRQIIEYKKNEMKCGMSESQTNNPT